MQKVTNQFVLSYLTPLSIAITLSTAFLIAALYLTYFMLEFAQLGVSFNFEHVMKWHTSLWMVNIVGMIASVANGIDGINGKIVKFDKYTYLYVFLGFSSFILFVARAVGVH